MSKITPIDQLTEDQRKFISLSIRLKKCLGYSPSKKGMLDLLNDCCDKIEELENKHLEDL